MAHPRNPSAGIGVTEVVVRAAGMLGVRGVIMGLGGVVGLGYGIVTGRLAVVLFSVAAVALAASLPVSLAWAQLVAERDPGRRWGTADTLIVLPLFLLALAALVAAIVAT